MAKRGINVRLRNDQEAALDAIVAEDKTGETDRSKLIRKAVDLYLKRQQQVARTGEDAPSYPADETKPDDDDPPQKKIGFSEKKKCVPLIIPPNKYDGLDTPPEIRC